MNVRIRGRIVSGNMGDGWPDQYEAAKAFAEFLKSRVEQHTRGIFGAEVAIDVAIVVERGSGRSPGISVDIDPLGETAEEVMTTYLCMSIAEESLWYVEDQTWNDFCVSSMKSQ